MLAKVMIISSREKSDLFKGASFFKVAINCYHHDYKVTKWQNELVLLLLRGNECSFCRKNVILYGL